MGNKFFSKVQWGKETTRGTAVAADTIELGQSFAINPDRKPTYPVEQFGVRAESLRTVVHQYLVMNTLKSDHAYFQQLPITFGCGVKGGVTATETTPAQSDYLWAFTPSLTAANAPDAITIEMGDDVQAWEAEYCMFERIRIGGSVSQGMDASPVTLERDFFGRQLTATTFTGAISLPTVEPMNAKLARFYVDTAWAGVGGTEKTATLRGFDIEILTGLHPIFSGSAAKFFDTYAEGLIGVTATFTLEGNAAANAIFTAMQAQTFQAVRLKILGPQIGTGTTHSLSIDIGGTWESVIPMNGEDRSDNLTQAVFRGFYDATGAKLLAVNVTTNTSAY